MTAEQQKNLSELLEKLNSKMIFTTITDSLVYFVEDIETVSEEDIIKLGYYAVSDGMHMIDFKKNVMCDISSMYGVKSFSPLEFSNLEDFYPEIGFYDEDVTHDQTIKSFDVFLERTVYANPIIYLCENGVTIKCENCYPGYKAIVNGIEYEVVDFYLINERSIEQLENTDVDMTKLCTTLVTDMSYLFCDTEFNQPIDSWDVSNVIDMSAMFKHSKFNQSIENWDVSKVESMEGMFAASEFNQPIGKWDVSNVVDMSYIFSDSKFKQSIENWKINTRVDIEFMF